MTTPTRVAPGWLRATLVALALTAATILALAPAGADTHTVKGWTYDTATGAVTASPDAWHKGGDGTITVTLWRRDVRDGSQTRLYRVTIPNVVPVTVQLGVIPAEACGGQWDVRDDATGVWLAGKQWQLPSCGGPTSTTTTSTSSTTEPTTTTTSSTTSTTTPPTTTTTTGPTWTTTQPPSSTTTTSPPTSSTTSTAASSSPPTGTTSSSTAPGTSVPSSTPPTTSSGPTQLPSTGNGWVGFVAPLGLLVMAAGMATVAWSNRRDGRYRR